MPVVSNTSPIWNLAAIERLHLLHEQFPDLRIPEDVWDELQVMRNCPEALRIQQARDAQWIKVESLQNPHVRQSLMLELDRGITVPVCTKRGGRTFGQSCNELIYHSACEEKL